MIIWTLLVVLSSYFAQIFCDYDSYCLMSKKETLDGLVVTWAPPNVTSPYAFSHLPRTVKEAEAQKWVKLDDGCKDSSLQHLGQRYILGEDRSVLIIYDKKGYVAGLLRTIPKALADSGRVLDFTKQEYAYQENIKGEDRYVFAVYFVNPKIICTGRSELQFKTQGTKTTVHIQNGPNSYLVPPNDQNEGKLQSQKWAKGKCVPSMGEHYYKDGYKDVICSEQKPYFLTYSCKRLISVGFFLIGNYTQEPRFEYVPENTLQIFIDPVPDCLYGIYGPKTYGITAMHMFFDNDPQKIPCSGPSKTY